MKKDKSELIAVIEKTIDVLENDKVKYNFFQAQHCNCGILAQQACDIDSNKLEKIFNESKSTNTFGAWMYKSKYCPTTGEPLSSVFAKLESIGCTREDIRSLESLSLNGEIIGDNNKKENVVIYLKAWRDLLIEESQPEVKTEYKLVYSDQKVKDLTKEELIMN